jgi:hypothetical protein
MAEKMTILTNSVPYKYVVIHLSLITFGFLLHLIDGYLTTSTIAGKAFHLGPFVFIAFTLVYLIKVIPFIALIITGKKVFKDLFAVGMIFGILIVLPELTALNPSPIGVSFFDILNRFTSYIAIFDLIISTYILYTTIYFNAK